MTHTMTREQILEIVNNVYRNNITPGIATEILYQQLSAERERAGKLVEALKSTILIFNKLGYPKTAEFVKQTIAEYDTQTKS